MPSITGEKAVEQIERMRSFLQRGDLSRTLEGPVLDVIYAGVLRNFLAESTPSHEPWLPLKPATIKRKKAKYPGSEKHILIESGAMLRAATGGAGSLVRVGWKELHVGISLATIPYARAQNYGRPEAKLPARRFWGIDSEHQARIAKLVHDAVSQQLTGTTGT